MPRRVSGRSMMIDKFPWGHRYPRFSLCFLSKKSDFRREKVALLSWAWPVARSLLCGLAPWRTTGVDGNTISRCAYLNQLDRPGVQILSPENRMDGARRGQSSAALSLSRPLDAHGTPPRHGPVNRVLCPRRADPRRS